MKSEGKKVGNLRVITTRIRSIYLGFLPFCILESFRAYVGYKLDEYDDTDEDMVINIEIQDGQTIEHEQGIYDWDKHDEEVD